MDSVIGTAHNGQQHRCTVLSGRPSPRPACRHSPAGSRAYPREHATRATASWMAGI